MTEILLDFLNGKITPQLMDLYLRAGGLIEFFEKDDQYDLMESMLYEMESGTMTAMQALDNIYLFHTSILSNIINEYGISLQDEVSLEDMIKIIESMQYLEDHEDKASIKATIEANESATETLLELLEFASIYTTDFFFPLITKVNPALLARLLELCDRESPEEMEGISPDRGVVKKLKKLNEIEKFRRSDVFKLIKSQLVIGIKFDLYLKLFSEFIFQEYKTNNDIAIDLYLLHLISKEEKDITQLINEKVINYVVDPVRVAEISAICRNISIEVGMNG